MSSSINIPENLKQEPMEDMPMMMYMSFYWTADCIFIFPGWETKTPAMFCLALLITALLVMSTHILIVIGSSQSQKSQALGNSQVKSIFYGQIVHLIQFISILLNLSICCLVMSYNGWILIVVCVAHLIGHLIFSLPVKRKHQKVVSIQNESDL